MPDPKAATTTFPKSTKTVESLTALQEALGRFAEESVRAAIEKQTEKLAPRAPNGGVSAEDLRQTVAEVVGAALIETDLIDKLVERHLKNRPQAAGPGGVSTEEVMRLVQTEFRGLLAKELKAFLVSNEFKEILDDKFRAITLYLKSDLLPKAIKEQLSKAERLVKA